MKIIDLVDDKIIITPEALCISPFKEIWTNDKDKSKKSAIEKIKYIWFYSDYESPYYKNYPEEIRGQMIIRDIVKDKSFKISEDITTGIKIYGDIHTSIEMRMLDGANIAVGKMEQYYRNVDFTGEDGDDIKKVTDSIIAMPKLVQALKDARRACQAEKDSGTKIRGNAELGQFEG